MDSLFNYFAKTDWIIVALIIVGATLAISLIFTFLVSLKLRGTKGFFITSILMPVLVSGIISMVAIFLSGTSSDAVRIATIAVALGLIRFRSANAKAEELLILFAGVAVGLIAGLGYVIFAAILAALVVLVYLILASVKVFNGKRFAGERMLRITIPESLEYSEVFEGTFSHYLKNYELVEVKTTGMGSLFRLSYRIELKNRKEEKEFIDELRTKNGNLEISILPFTAEDKSL